VKKRYTEVKAKSILFEITILLLCYIIRSCTMRIKQSKYKTNYSRSHQNSVAGRGVRLGHVGLIQFTADQIAAASVKSSAAATASGASLLRRSLHISTERQSSA